MSEYSKFHAYKKKLEGVCDENNLVFRFRNTEYPISLTILPNQGVEEQMDLLASDTDKVTSSPDARLVFYYKDGDLIYRISEGFVIGDALFSKLKNLYNNMHFTWLQYFFRNLVERRAIPDGSMPVIDEDDADDTPELPPEAEPLETDEDEPAAGCDASEVLISRAAEVVRLENKATVQLLQRRLNVGYATAQAVMDELEKRGVVGPYNDGQPREVLPVDEPEE
jgi:ribosomal protein S25